MWQNTGILLREREHPPPLFSWLLTSSGNKQRRMELSLSKLCYVHITRTHSSRIVELTHNTKKKVEHIHLWTVLAVIYSISECVYSFFLPTVIKWYEGRIDSWTNWLCCARENDSCPVGSFTNTIFSLSRTCKCKCVYLWHVTMVGLCPWQVSFWISLWIYERYHNVASSFRDGKSFVIVSESPGMHKSPSFPKIGDRAIVSQETTSSSLNH